MILTKYILKSCIVPRLLAANKSDAIKELTHLIFGRKRLKGVELALDQVIAREMIESTGIGRGLAVPHARITGVKTLACAVGRIPGGIDFTAVDHKPVHLVFLILYPPTEQTTYLNFIATVSKLLRAPANRDAMLEAKTSDEMYTLLHDASLSLYENPETVAHRVERDPKMTPASDAHPDLILLARIQLYQEMLKGSRSGKTELRQRIEKTRSLVDPHILKHYDRLTRAQPPALVPVEGDTCQGCFMKLPSKFAQRVRQDTSHIHTCMNCSRFIYVV